MIRARDIMNCQPILISPKETVKTAIACLAKNKICGLPVVEESRRLVGVITYKNILDYITREFDLQKSVEQIMAINIQTVLPDELFRKFSHLEVTILPVETAQGEFVGIITKSSLIKGFIFEGNKISNKFNTTLEFVYDGIIGIDRSGLINLFNKGAEKITGLLKEKVLGKAIQETIPEVGLLGILESDKPLLNQKIKLLDSMVICNLVPLFEKNQLTGAIAVFLDISELEIINEQLATMKSFNKELNEILGSFHHKDQL